MRNIENSKNSEEQNSICTISDIYSFSKVDFVKCCALETDVDDEEKNLTGIREAIGI